MTFIMIAFLTGQLNPNCTHITDKMFFNELTMIEERNERTYLYPYELGNLNEYTDYELQDDLSEELIQCEGAYK